MGSQLAEGDLVAEARPGTGKTTMTHPRRCSAAATILRARPTVGKMASCALARRRRGSAEGRPDSVPSPLDSDLAQCQDDGCEVEGKGDGVGYLRHVEGT